MHAEIALGFILALVAACCYETGYALQAIEARRAPADRALRPTLVTYLLTRPLWVGATALSLLGWPLQIAALSHAPLTLVQPVLALGLLLAPAAAHAQTEGIQRETEARLWFHRVLERIEAWTGMPPLVALFTLLALVLSLAAGLWLWRSRRKRAD